MGAYINRDELMELYADIGGLDISNYDIKVAVIRQNILDMPTIDIVMCQECEHYNGHEEYCEIDHFARENGFCSDGKRRENDMGVRDNAISIFDEQRELTDEEMQAYKDMLRKKEVQMELKLERKSQKHRAIISRGILDTIEYEMTMENTVDDILDIIIDIRDTAERIIKLMALQKGE